MDRLLKPILLAALAVPGAASALAAGEMLPVTSVNAYMNGVAFFEHSGTIDGDLDIILPAAAADVDDLLQSLVLQDLDGGTIDSVRYATESASAAGSGLPDNPTLARLLLDAQGQEVSVTPAGGSAVSGRIVSVEQVGAPDGEERNLLLLASDDGLTRIALEDMEALSFSDSGLQEQLLGTLEGIASRRSADEYPLTLAFRGEGERRVRIGYVRELPVWKATYRLVLDDEGSAELQGWALLDNTSGLDLEGVNVTFTAGHPVSFITRLHEAVHVERPRVDPPVMQTASAPAPQEESFRDTAARQLVTLSAAAEAQQATADDAANFGAGFSARTEGRQRGATFSYEVKEPVNLKAGESAMLPVVQATVPAERFSLYDPEAGFGDQPIRAVRLDNDSGLHLAAGTVTVFEDGAFTGTARFDNVLPGGQPLLAFAADQSVTVRREAAPAAERTVPATVRDAPLVTEARSRYATTWTLNRTGSAEDSRLVLIQQPRRSGYTLSLPDGLEAEETGNYWRFPVLLDADLPAGDASSGDASGRLECDSGSSCSFTVLEERLLSRRMALSSLTQSDLTTILSDTRPDEEAAALLRALLENGRELGSSERRLAELETERDDIFSEQERIRSNMAELDRDSDLYARYVARLEEQEDRLIGLTEERQEVRADIARLRSAREDLLRGND